MCLVLVVHMLCMVRLMRGSCGACSSHGSCASRGACGSYGAHGSFGAYVLCV